MAKKKEPDAEDVVSGFVVDAVGRTDGVFLGIDPGAHGAIAMLCGRRHAVVDIPVIKVPVTRSRQIKEPAPGGPKSRTIHGETTLYNYSAIVALFRLLRPLKDRIVVALEIAIPQVGGGAARNSLMVAYRTGIAYGMWPLFLAGKGYPIDAVQPSVWKPKMGLRTVKTGKAREDSSAAKELSRSVALRLFPRAAITRKSDHDRAEALLLAEYSRRLRGGAFEEPRKKRKVRP